AILPKVLRRPVTALRVAGADVPLPDGLLSDGADKLESLPVALRGGAWKYVPPDETSLSEGKRPGLQGTSDHAVNRPVLCVRGTGTPWNAAVQEWAKANLRRLAYEWHHYFRGKLPQKDDTEVTDDDIRHNNLILFGDPGSNRYIAEVLAHLPIQWTPD